MGAVVTVVFRPSVERAHAFEQLLEELSTVIRSQPPQGMNAMSILRGDGHVLVQASWDSAQEQKAFRASPSGGRIFKAMSECAVKPPVTYTSSEDGALSFSRGSEPNA